MKKIIRQRALELGFDDCRFTHAMPPDHSAEFQKWLSSKQHGEMAYLERNARKRVNPSEVLSGAKSLVVLAASYEKAPFRIPSDETRLSLTDYESRNTNHGIIARYARFTDYHDIL